MPRRRRGTVEMGLHTCHASLQHAISAAGAGLTVHTRRAPRAAHSRPLPSPHLQHHAAAGGAKEARQLEVQPDHDTLHDVGGGALESEMERAGAGGGC